jgi:hypothetical protein
MGKQAPLVMSAGPWRDGMRRLAVAVALTCALAITAAAPAPVLGQADSYWEEQVYSLDTDSFNPCTGERVRLTGQLVSRTHVVRPRENVSLSNAVLWTDVSAVGETTGTVYQFQEVQRINQKFLPNGGIVRVDVIRFNLISPQPGDDWRVTIVGYQRYSPSGEVLASWERPKARCTG